MANVGKREVEVTVRMKRSGRLFFCALGVLLVLLLCSLPLAGRYALEEGPAWISAPRLVFDGTPIGHVGGDAVLGTGMLVGLASLAGAVACFVRASMEE